MDTTVVVAAALAVGFVVAVVVRELVCWYFKASEQVRLLKAIETHLEALEARSRGAEPRARTSPAAYPGGVPAVGAGGRRPTFMERLG